MVILLLCMYTCARIRYKSLSLRDGFDFRYRINCLIVKLAEEEETLQMLRSGISRGNTLL